MNIPGPAGDIELHHVAHEHPRAIAVLSHPHPLYGGSMHDGVLDLAAEAMARSSMSTVRFNFRGVGASEGTHDKGEGEVDDLLAVAAWARAQAPDLPLWLLGYSFGALVTWRALAQAEPQRAILIAPPVGMMDFSGNPPLATRVSAVAGDQDDFVDAQAFKTWLGDDAYVISGADHFFSGAPQALSDCLDELIDGS